MSHRHPVRITGVVLLVLLGWLTRDFDPLRDSLPRSEPQAIYGPDREDAWNQMFFLLFTRTLPSRLIADGAKVYAAGDDRLVLSDRRVTRIESGDRAIDPLYPSWLWMNSAVYDFEPDRKWRILQEPRYSQFVAALEGVRRTASSRPPLARALMQADLWSVFDMLHNTASTPRDQAGAMPSPDRTERQTRAQSLLPLVATTMRALALSGEEIARLPDTYAAAARTHRLPDVFRSSRGNGNGSGSGWMEIRWFPLRHHESAADHRRAARVFIEPAVRPVDTAAFLDRFRDQEGGGGDGLRSVALLIQLLLVTSDGMVVPSRITYEAQFRGAAARPNGAEIPQYELSRRAGALVGFAANAPAYLPMAGNDLSFATPPRLDGEPVIAPLASRCTLCHGAGTDVGRLMTFSKVLSPGRPLPAITRLVPADNVHPGDVARRKMDRDDFKSLRQHWH